MTNIHLELDEKATRTIDKLKKHYHASNNAELISLAIKLLNCAYKIENEHGTLVAITNGKETRIVI